MTKLSLKWSLVQNIMMQLSLKWSCFNIEHSVLDPEMEGSAGRFNIYSVKSDIQEHNADTDTQSCNYPIRYSRSNFAYRSDPEIRYLRSNLLLRNQFPQKLQNIMKYYLQNKCGQPKRYKFPFP